MSRLVFFVVCVALFPFDGFAQSICTTSSTPFALARMPFQVVRTMAAQPAVAAKTGRPTKEKVESVLAVPDGRFVIIDSVAIKTTRPTDAYLAIELRTTALNDGGRLEWARHFLYAKDGPSSDGGAVHIREPLKLYAASRSRVELGVQSTLDAAIDRIVVTLTGEYVDCRLWGR